MQQELRTLLMDDPDLAALIERRVDWTRSKQGALNPRIVLSLISGPTTYHSKGPNTLYQHRVQVDVWAGDAGQRLAVATPLDALLSGYRGLVGAISFRRISIEAVRETGGEQIAGGAYLYRRQIDIMVNWKRITVT
jgi:hypothetical protein